MNRITNEQVRQIAENQRRARKIAAIRKVAAATKESK